MLGLQVLGDLVLACPKLYMVVGSHLLFMPANSYVMSNLLLGTHHVVSRSDPEPGKIKNTVNISDLYHSIQYLHWLKYYICL